MVNSPTNDSEARATGQEVDELLRALALRLHSLIPQDSSSITLDVCVTDTARSAVLRAHDSTEKLISVKVDRQVVRLAVELRGAMYRPKSGSWFSAAVTVTVAGKVDATYNYDEEPAWPFRVDPQVYATDLQAFPRDDAHMPEWLRQKVRDHAAGKTE